MIRCIDKQIEFPEVLLEFYNLTGLLILHSAGIFFKDSALKKRFCKSASIGGFLVNTKSFARCPRHRVVLILTSLADITEIDLLKTENVQKIIVFDVWSPVRMFKRIFFPTQKIGGYSLKEYFVFETFANIKSVMPMISIVPPRRTWSLRGGGLPFALARLLYWSLYRVKLSRELLFDRIVVYDCETTLKF